MGAQRRRGPAAMGAWCVLIIAAGAAASAELALRTPAGDLIQLPTDNSTRAVKQWASTAGIPKPRKFAGAYAERYAGMHHHGYTFVKQVVHEPHNFWEGLFYAVLLASVPAAICEVIDDGKLSSITAGLVLMLPLFVVMGACSILAYWVETRGFLWPSTLWTPSVASFCTIFGPSAVTLVALSVVNQIKLGALLMLVFAWLYFFTEARLTLLG